MTTNVEVNTAPIIQTIADNLGGANWWPMVIIAVLIYFDWTRRRDSKSLNKSVDQINNAVNHSDEDEDEATKGKPLRDMVKGIGKRVDKLSDTTEKHGGLLEAVILDVREHRANDAVVIETLARELKEARKGVE